MTGAFQKGVAAHKLGDGKTAASFYKSVDRDNPRYADAQFLLAMLCLSETAFKAGREHIENAIAGRPGEEKFHLCHGEILFSLSKQEAALTAFKRHLVLNPAAASSEGHGAYGILAPTYENTGDIRSALRMADARMVIRETPDAHIVKARVLSKANRFEIAASIRDRAIFRKGSYDPLADLNGALIMPAIPQNQDQIIEIRQNFADALNRVNDSGLNLDDPAGQIAEAPVYLAYHGLDNRPLMEMYSNVLRKCAPVLQREKPKWKNQAHTESAIKVGIFSRHLYRHTILFYSEGLIREIARRSDTQTFILSPSAIPPDGIRYLESFGAEYIALNAAYDSICGKIRDIGIDVLLFPDVGLDPLSYALAMTPLAARQIALPGHPDTTGIGELDGFVTCRKYERAGFQAYYSEPLLDAGFWPLGYPARAFGASQKSITEQISATGNQRLKIACIQSLFKIHPDMDAVFKNVLEASPKGTKLTFVKPDKKQSFILDTFAKRLAGHGIDVESQIEFADRMTVPDFFTYLSGVDILLDSWHFSGGDSSIAAITAGTPVVTWQGAFFRGRQTSSLYEDIGFSDLIADSPENYTALLIRLMEDAGFRRHAGETMKNASHRLYGRSDGLSRLAGDIIDPRS